MNARRVVLVVSGVILLALTVAPLWLFSAELPEPLASQWDLRGVPQSAMPARAFGLLMGALATLGAGALVWAGVARVLPRGTRGVVAGVGGAHAVFLAGIASQVVLGQRGVTDWRAAHGPSLLEVGLILGGAALLGGALSRVARGWPDDTAQGADAAQRADAAQGAPATLGLGRDEHAVWVRRVSAPGLYVLAALGVVLLAFGLVFDQVVLVLSGAVLIPLSTEMATAVVCVDQRGLWVHWGTFGLWRTGVPLSDVVRAEAIDIHPLQWGGWGYRGSLKVMGRAAVVLRKGPGMRLELRGDRVLAVTVDDAGTAAGLLNDLVARQA